MNKWFELAKPHLIAVAIFLGVFATYFHPQLEGLAVNMRDIQEGKGMIKEANDYHEKTGKYTLWTNAMFGGMPMYQISSPQNGNFVAKYIEPILHLWFNAPIAWFFTAALCFYILMMVMGVNHWLSIIGGLAFSLGTNHVILFAEGHTSKFRAISYLPLAIAGVYLLLEKRKYLAGGIVFLLAMALNLAATHYQMTYYFAIGLGLFMVFYLVYALKQNAIMPYLKSVGIMLIAGILAVGPSFGKLYPTLEYAKFTMRGNSELKKEAALEKAKGMTEEERAKAAADAAGLDWDYAMLWSNNSIDFLATFIPGAAGGSTGEKAGEGYKVTDTYKSDVINWLYWGGAESTSGPVYFGAVLALMVVIGLFSIENKAWAYGIFAAMILIALLSFGKHFELLNEFAFKHFPKYKTFRSHNSAMGVAAVFFAIVGVYGLSEFINSKKSEKEKIKILFWSVGIVGGLSAICILLGGSLFSFSHFEDDLLFARYQGQFQTQQNFDNYMSLLMDDRVHYFRASAIRTLIFVLLVGGSLWLYVTKKLQLNYVLGIVGILVLIDMIGINNKYLSTDEFVEKSKVDRPFVARPVDNAIMQQEPKGRGYYRVFDGSINTFNTSFASYFHNTVGGYSAVKMGRIQDVIDTFLRSPLTTTNIMDMFNVKYFINNQGQVIPNAGALGNAWFVDSFIHVSTATEELKTLETFNTATTAIVHDKDFGDYTKSLINKPVDSSSTRKIELASYEPNRLVYKSSTAKEEFAVFSEIYYAPNVGWNVYLDNKLLPENYSHIRTDYLLRGMKIPAGNHEIVFEFKPAKYYTGEKISYASSSIIILLLLGWLFMEYKKLDALPMPETKKVVHKKK
ncbi:MAG: hypothetical protein H6607_12510 [Flavobacteriales bacterium]|nr:hypothetical protein [Flavobacteriales bacterium]